MDTRFCEEVEDRFRGYTHTHTHTHTLQFFWCRNGRDFCYAILILKSLCDESLRIHHCFAVANARDA